MNREIAWRVFAGEYNDATKEMSDGGDRSPSYLVTPLGAKVNRLFVVGVLTDVENVATDEAPMWRARLQDPTGTYHIYAGQYQPEASAALAKLKPPAFVAVTGKSRLFTPESGGTYTSIRPETVKVVDEGLRDYWILEASRSLKKRLEALREAYKMDPPKKEELAALGIKPAVAEGILVACCRSSARRRAKRRTPRNRPPRRQRMRRRRRLRRPSSGSSGSWTRTGRGRRGMESLGGRRKRAWTATSLRRRSTPFWTRG